MPVPPVSQVSFSGLDGVPGATMASLLQAKVGHFVELHCKSGEQITGRLERVGENLVFVVHAAGARPFEAAVALGEIAAVVSRSDPWTGAACALRPLTRPENTL